MRGMGEKRVLLLTGRPGVGKTTVVRAVAARLRTGPDRVRVAGFFTEEVRDGSGRRTGFVGETFGGRRKIIASVNRSVGLRGGGLIAAVKRHPSAAIREVTRENRDALPPRVVAWLTELLGIPD